MLVELYIVIRIDPITSFGAGMGILLCGQYTQWMRNGNLKQVLSKHVEKGQANIHFDQS